MSKNTAESCIEMEDASPHQSSSPISIEVAPEGALTCGQVWKRTFFFRFLLLFTLAITLLLIIGAILMQFSLDNLQDKYDEEKAQVTNYSEYIQTLTKQVNELETINNDLSKKYNESQVLVKELNDTLTATKEENAKLQEQNAKLKKVNTISKIGWISTGIVAAAAIGDDIRLRLQKKDVCENTYLLLYGVS